LKIGESVQRWSYNIKYTTQDKKNKITNSNINNHEFKKLEECDPWAENQISGRYYLSVSMSLKNLVNFPF